MEKKGTCQLPYFNQVMNPFQPQATKTLKRITEFFVPLDLASEALGAVSQVAAKWPGWLHAENAKGLKYEHQPLVYHCEVRVGKFFSFNIMQQEKS